MDRDGNNDVIVTDGFDRVFTFFNRPSQRNFVGPVVSQLALPAWHTGFQALLAMDADRDGDCDIVVQSDFPDESGYNFSPGPLGGILR
ncbi:MAG: hypothetical protein N3C12_02255 [Candidatus Binatia bacterium]|nr:hypothetical protein [Candidatus Binatia bacterium]